MLASGSFSGEIKLWDIETSTAIATFDINPYHILNMCFSADGTKFATMSYEEDDTVIHIWDILTDLEITQFRCFNAYFKILKFLHNSNILILNETDLTLKFFDTDTLEEIINLDLNYEYIIIDICFAHNSNILAVGYSDRIIRIFNIIYENNVLNFIICGELQYLNCEHELMFSLDDSKLVATSNETKIKVWNMTTYDEIATNLEIMCFLNQIYISDDNKKLLYVSKYGELYIYIFKTIDWTEYEKITIQLNSSNTIMFSAVCISEDGSKIATYCRDRFIKIWNTDTFEEITTLIASDIDILHFQSNTEIVMW